MLTHLIELRKRMIQSLVFFGLCFLLLFVYANPLYLAVVSPLISQLSGHNGLIATQITTGLMTPLKLAMQVAMLISTPFWLWQLFAFVSPALYPKEQQPLRFIMLSSVMLFILGMIFCYFLVLPFVFAFFSNTMPEGVKLMPDMGATLDFITRMLLIFGLSFQVPLICVLLVRSQLCTVEQLKAWRPYVITGAFIIGMLLTPPDVLSQILLALPICLLFEAGLFLAQPREK